MLRWLWQLPVLQYWRSKQNLTFSLLCFQNPGIYMFMKMRFGMFMVRTLASYKSLLFPLQFFHFFCEIKIDRKKSFKIPCIWWCMYAIVCFKYISKKIIFLKRQRSKMICIHKQNNNDSVKWFEEKLTCLEIHQLSFKPLQFVK